jgi:hypothetical protein
MSCAAATFQFLHRIRLADSKDPELFAAENGG